MNISVVPTMDETMPLGAGIDENVFLGTSDK
jgi:hypothetical protein